MNTQTEGYIANYNLKVPIHYDLMVRLYTSDFDFTDDELIKILSCSTVIVSSLIKNVLVLMKHREHHGGFNFSKNIPKKHAKLYRKIHILDDLYKTAIRYNCYPLFCYLYCKGEFTIGDSWNFAWKSGKLDFFMFHLANGIRIDYHTQITEFIREGLYKIVEYCLQNGTNIEDLYTNDVLHAIVHTKNLKIIDLLFKYGFNKNRAFDRLLEYTIDSENIAMLKIIIDGYLFEYTREKDAKNHISFSLCRSVIKNNWEMTKLLLDQLEKSERNSLFFYAIRNDRVDIVKHMLENGFKASDYFLRSSPTYSVREYGKNMSDLLSTYFNNEK